MKARSIALASICITFVALVACRKETAPAAATDAGAGWIFATADSGIVPALGSVCANDLDCPHTGGPGCYWDCTGPKSNGKYTCAVFAKNAPLGSKNCYGDSNGSMIWTLFPSESPQRGVLCDLRHDAFCDEKTRACVAVLKVGDACTIPGSSCGRSGACRGGKCVARPKLGESCDNTVHFCVGDATCDDATKKCVPLKQKGAECGMANDCASGACDGHCVDAPTPTPTCAL